MMTPFQVKKSLQLKIQQVLSLSQGHVSSSERISSKDRKKSSIENKKTVNLFSSATPTAFQHQQLLLNIQYCKFKN